jgi:antagonist of KipI
MDRQRFFDEPWTVTSQSDRVGYRLFGTSLTSKLPQMISEPVRMGTIQVPESGQPIVMMRDGPTVGGYPKLGVLDSADVAWLAQCRPGQHIRFQAAGTGWV